MDGYPNILKYFMWSYQVYFGIGLQTKAESIFKGIGADLEPTVFMIGMLSDPKMSHAPVSFEPEEFDYYGTDIFDEFYQTVEEQYRASEESQMYYSGQGQQELMQEKHLANHRRMLLRRLLDERSSGNIHYVGAGQFLHGYEIFVVVRFVKEIHDKYIYLLRNHLESDDRFIVRRSVLEAAVGIFLKDAQNSMHIPDAGRDNDSFKSHKEYLRLATQELMGSLAVRGRAFMGMHGFYQMCETLSLSTYENEAVKGGLIIAPKEHDAIEMLSTLAEPFNFSEHRKTMKLLRLSESDICVVSDTEKVFGLGKIDNQKYQADSESLITVNFTDFHQWEAVHNGNRLLRMTHGDFDPIDNGFSVDKLFSDASRIFSTVDKEECQLILELIDTAIKEKRGTQLIISENADTESDRLKARCFKTTPKPLKPDELVRLMRIDGGIMLDQHLNLHAYGVLLDGTLAKKGDSSRGARHNSALTYYEMQETINPTMIVVISDDGMVTLIPNLRPQVKHSLIIKAIEIMGNLETEENYVHKVFVETQDWLRYHRFYLREEECRQLNDSMEKISKHRLRTHGMSFGYGDYSPNDDMNDSYYLTEVF